MRLKKEVDGQTGQRFWSGNIFKVDLGFCMGLDLKRMDQTYCLLDLEFNGSFLLFVRYKSKDYCCKI